MTSAGAKRAFKAEHVLKGKQQCVLIHLCAWNHDLLTVDLDKFAEIEQCDIEAKLSIDWLV